MALRILGDATVVLHLAFVIFVLLGGLLVLRWTRVVWLHLPAVVWGAWIEFAGSICPLTPLENWFRAQGGGAVYDSGFVEHYLLPILYPDALSRELQWALGGFVLLINAVVYGVVLGRHRRAHGRTTEGARRQRVTHGEDTTC
jgi:hypothetical protein